MQVRPGLESMSLRSRDDRAEDCRTQTGLGASLEHSVFSSNCLSPEAHAPTR